MACPLRRQDWRRSTRSPPKETRDGEGGVSWCAFKNGVSRCCIAVNFDQETIPVNDKCRSSAILISHGENDRTRKRDDTTRDGGDAFSAALRYQLTCTLPRVAPCGLPAAVSLAASLAAWVPSRPNVLPAHCFRCAIALVLPRHPSREVGRLGEPSLPKIGRGTSPRCPTFYPKNRVGTTDGRG